MLYHISDRLVNCKKKGKFSLFIFYFNLYSLTMIVITLWIIM